MQITNYDGIPDLYYRAIKALDGSRKPERKTIRTTQLIDSPLIRNLQRDHWDEIQVEASSNWHSFMGTLGHRQVLECSPMKPWESVEQSFSTELDGWTITCTVDYIDSKNQIIKDLKFTGTSQREKHKQSWDEQLNVYAYIVYKNLGWMPKKLYIDKGFKNHSSYMHSFNPCEEVEIELWSVDKMESFILHRLLLHSQEDYRCTDDDRWATEDTFAVKKNNNKNAVKLFNTRDLAQAKVEELTEKSPKDYYFIEFRPKVYNRCSMYCDFCSVCPLLREEV